MGLASVIVRQASLLSGATTGSIPKNYTGRITATGITLFATMTLNWALFTPYCTI